MADCSLAPADLQARLRRFEELARAALIDAERTRDGVRLQLRATDAVRREVDALIAAEAACCPFLDFAADERQSVMRLEVTGPRDAAPLLDGLFASALTR